MIKLIDILREFNEPFHLNQHVTFRSANTNRFGVVRKLNNKTQVATVRVEFNGAVYIQEVPYNELRKLNLLGLSFPE